KDIAKLFKIIELDNSQISMVGNLVDTRNEMAHASGIIEILNISKTATLDHCRNQKTIRNSKHRDNSESCKIVVDKK
ncbi:MAG: hypothetical protein PHT25_08845, partial [Bacteroidales bacterium]|nr:hypothetical protein [Bacteroidales bacterium]